MTCSRIEKSNYIAMALYVRFLVSLVDVGNSEVPKRRRRFDGHESTKCSWPLQGLPFSKGCILSTPRVLSVIAFKSPTPNVLFCSTSSCWKNDSVASLLLFSSNIVHEGSISICAKSGSIAGGVFMLWSQLSRRFARV